MRDRIFKYSIILILFGCMVVYCDKMTCPAFGEDAGVLSSGNIENLLDHGGADQLKGLESLEQLIRRRKNQNTSWDDLKVFLPKIKKAFNEPGALPQTDEDMKNNKSEKNALNIKMEAIVVMRMLDKELGDELLDQGRQSQNKFVKELSTQMKDDLLHENIHLLSIQIDGLKPNQVIIIAKTLLESDDRDVRCLAAQGLSKVAPQLPPDSFDLLMNLVMEKYKHEKQWIVRNQLVTISIAGIKLEKVRAFLREVRDSQEETRLIRQLAASALGSDQ